MGRHKQVKDVTVFEHFDCSRRSKEYLAAYHRYCDSHYHQFGGGGKCAGCPLNEFEFPPPRVNPDKDGRFDDIGHCLDRFGDFMVSAIPENILNGVKTDAE